MTFSEQALIDKLAKLADTQDSISLLSHWLIYHRANARECVAVWASEFGKVSTSKRLAFLHLANDVLQVSRKKADDYAKAFAKVLPSCLRTFSSRATDDLNAKARRILSIWQERGVYASDVVTELKACVKGPAASGSSGSSGSASASVKSPSKTSPVSAKPPTVPTASTAASAQHSETVKSILAHTESIKHLNSNRTHLERTIASTRGSAAATDSTLAASQENALTLALTNELRERQKLIDDLKRWIKSEEASCAKIVDAMQDLAKASSLQHHNPTPSPTSPNNSSAADFDSSTPVMSPNSPNMAEAAMSSSEDVPMPLASASGPPPLPPPPPPPPLPLNTSNLGQFIIPPELLSAAQSAIQSGAPGSDEMLSLLTGLGAAGAGAALFGMGGGTGGGGSQGGGF